MAQLKFDSELFVQSVLANPENQMLTQQPQQQQHHLHHQQQQQQQHEDGFCDSRLSQTLGDMFSDPNIFQSSFDDLDDLDPILQSSNSVLADLSD
jgi:hypothetical protein